MNNYRELRAHLGNEPYLPVNGNHDDNSIWDTYAEEAERGTHQVTAEDLYTVFYNHLPHIPGVEFNEEKGLYYIYNDFAKKVRYIFLDLNELPYEMDENRINIYSREHSYSISQEQLDWLTQKALRFEEEGWDIVVISHTFFRGNESDEGYIKFLYQLLDTYKRGEDLTGMIEQAHGTLKIDAKFSQYKRGTILGCFAGHYHDDYMLRTDEGIPVIFTDCAIMYDYKTPRKDGDKSELLFDMVTIDRQNRTIYLTRIGAGEDRTVIEYS